MKRNVCAIMLALLLAVMVPVAAFANTVDGNDIAFSDWANAGFGSWQEGEDGVLSPAELTDFTLLRLEKDLGEQYTIELDVKQEDLDSGWQTINIGFEVNEGENFTQSGFTLDLHNAGVARVIVYSSANAGAGTQGSYDNPYGGNLGYAPNTEWRHIKIQRDGADFTIVIDEDPAQTITFTCDTVSGGHLVLGAVGCRNVSYKNISITTVTETTPEPGDDIVSDTGDPMHVVALAGALALIGACTLAAANTKKKEI